MTVQRNESISRMEMVIQDMAERINSLATLIDEEKAPERKLMLQSLAEQGTALSISLLEINNSIMSEFSSVQKNAIIKIVSNAEKWVEVVKRLEK
ncbi:hypothetical protein GCM10011607_12320 [Shewanella inventionis]|uniref:Uncharacterized protein n=1 Tax=Shewanella inventionis TaxID=1738770 RepID=A0ABQ1IVS9_9GAMM|nr:hypothetical protein [Shewanella inventionis]GGB53307.1 hypothetical protein GCM10011607_12320 [Shewanella inventionis]